jgi:hypothetical protein
MSHMEEPDFSVYGPDYREAARWQWQQGEALRLQGCARSELWRSRDRNEYGLPRHRLLGLPDLINLNDPLVIVRCKCDTTLSGAVLRSAIGPVLVTAHDDEVPNTLHTFIGDDGVAQIYDQPRAVRRYKEQFVPRPRWMPRLDVLVGPSEVQGSAWPLICRKCHRALDSTRDEILVETTAALRSRRRVVKS